MDEFRLSQLPSVRLTHATGLKMLLDEAQGTAVVLQYFATEEDMKAGAAAFGAMDASETPGTRASVDMCEIKLERDLS
jgi:hypothetical protein